MLSNCMVLQTHEQSIPHSKQAAVTPQGPADSPSPAVLHWHKQACFKGKQQDQLLLAAYPLRHRLRSHIPSPQRLLLHGSAKMKEQRCQLGSMVQNALMG